MTALKYIMNKRKKVAAAFELIGGYIFLPLYFEIQSSFKITYHYKSIYNGTNKQRNTNKQRRIKQKNVNGRRHWLIIDMPVP